MADRICSLCGESYTDEKGHNYNECVVKCKQNIQRLEEQRRNIDNALNDADKHLEEAIRIQKQDWWKEKLARNK